MISTSSSAPTSRFVLGLGEAGSAFSAHLPRPLGVVAGILDTTDPFDKQMATLHGAGVLNQIAGDQSPVGTHCTLYPSAITAPIKVCIHDGAHVYPPWAPESFVSFFKSHALP